MTDRTDNARADEQRSEYTVQETAAHFARKVQRVSDRIRSTDYQRSVSDIVALDNVEGFLDRIARDDLDVFAAGRAEAERPACTWPRCKSPATGKCFAWCKCICHEWSAAHRAAGRAETTTATTEDAVERVFQTTHPAPNTVMGWIRAGYEAGLLATAHTRPTETTTEWGVRGMDVTLRAGSEQDARELLAKSADYVLVRREVGPWTEADQ